MDIDELNDQLVDAADEGDLEGIKYLVSQGADITADNNDALRFASSNDDLDIVKYLISEGVTDFSKGIISASAYDNLDIIKYLLSQKGGVDSNAMADAVVAAGAEGHLEVVKYLVSEGANITVEAINETLVNDHLEVAKYLVKRSSLSNIDIRPILEQASRNGQLEMVKYLVEYKRPYLNTALIYASENGQLEVVKYLVSEGADISTDDEAPFRVASTNGHLEVLKYLLGKDPEIDFTINNNEAIKRAVKNDHLDVVKYLVFKGADINVAISTARKVGNIQIAEELEEAPKTDYPTEIAEKGDPVLGHLKKEEMEEYNKECTNPPFLGEIEEYGSAEPGQVVVVKEGGKLFCFTIEEILGLEESRRNPFTRTKLPKKLFIEARKRKKVYDRYFQAEYTEEISPKTMAYSKLWNTISSRGYPIDQESYDELSNRQVQGIFDIVINNSMTSLSPAVIVRVRRSKDKHLPVVEAFNELLDKSSDKNTDSLLIIQSFNEISSDEGEVTEVIVEDREDSSESEEEIYHPHVTLRRRRRRRRRRR